MSTTIIEVNESIRNRFGILTVSDCMIDDVIDGKTQAAQAAWAAVFNGFVITRAEASYRMGAVIYEGYHPKFDEVDLGVSAPRYKATVIRSIGDHGITTFEAAFTRE